MSVADSLLRLASGNLIDTGRSRGGLGTDERLGVQTGNIPQFELETHRIHAGCHASFERFDSNYRGV